MIGFSKYRFNLWNVKNFSFRPRLMTFISRFYLTCEKVNLINVQGDSAGVLGVECGIRVRNENAPIVSRGVYRAVSPIDDLDISIVAHSELNRNNSVRCYV
jgi:hypothetical protein